MGHPINESLEQGLIYLGVNIYTSSVKKTLLWFLYLAKLAGPPVFVKEKVTKSTNGKIAKSF